MCNELYEQAKLVSILNDEVGAYIANKNFYQIKDDCPEFAEAHKEFEDDEYGDAFYECQYYLSDKLCEELCKGVDKVVANAICSLIDFSEIVIQSF